MTVWAEEFQDMMPDVIEAQFMVQDAFGGVTPSGEVLTIPCRIRARSELIRDTNGQETVSRFHVQLGEVHNFDVDSYRFTLPDRFDPHEDLRALSIEKGTDEDGPAIEVIHFR